ncbi:MAG: PQQ-binding-like beta-propeller repeat protein [Phycisphaerae bacterium]
MPYGCTIAVTLLCAAVTAPAGDNWPQWRGPHLTGVSDATNLPLTWSESQNIAWKVPLPAWGAATPIVWGDRVFVISPSRAPEDGDEPGVSRRLPPMMGRSEPGGPDLLLLCFSTRDGTLRWRRRLGAGNTLYGKQNMASPSPVTDGRHVWTMTGTGLLSAFDIDGEPVWQRDLQKDFGPFGLYWGYASSPLLHDGKIIVEVLHGAVTDDPAYVVAFDAATGATRWKVNRPTDATRESPDAYTTPTLLRHNGKTRVVISGANCVTAHDPNTGEEIWRAGGLNPKHRGNFRICGTPTAVDGYVYATSRVKPVLAFRAGGTGDVSKSNLAWTYTDKGGPDVPSPACDGHHLYLVDDKGVATCLNAKTGHVVWGPARTARGTVSASPLLADGKLYITNETATTTVLAAGPDFNILATNKLDGGYTIASIAAAGTRLYIRTASHLYCIANKP